MTTLPREKFDNLIRNKDEPEKDVVNEFGTQLTEEKMRKLFAGGDEKHPYKRIFYWIVYNWQPNPPRLHPCSINSNARSSHFGKILKIKT